MQDVKSKSGYHHGDLRQQLISATRALVEKKGPDSFSVTEACRAAGVSTAAPYRHFADRTEMLNAVSLEGFAEMTAAFETAVTGHAPGSVEAISALGTAYVTFAERNPGVFRMMFAGGHDNPDLTEAGHGCYGVLLAQIAARLGVAEVNDEVLRRGFPLWTFVHGLSFLRIDGKADFAKSPIGVAELVADATRRLLD